MPHGICELCGACIDAMYYTCPGGCKTPKPVADIYETQYSTSAQDMLTRALEDELRRPGPYSFSKVLERGRKARQAMADERSERRAKMIYLRPDDILILLNLNVSEDAYVVRFKGIPDGAKARSINFEPARNAWAVIVEHPSFDPVPDAHMVPEIPGYKELMVKRFGVDLAEVKPRNIVDATACQKAFRPEWRRVDGRLLLVQVEAPPGDPRDLLPRDPVGSGKDSAEVSQKLGQSGHPCTLSEAISALWEEGRIAAGPNPTRWIDDFMAGKKEPERLGAPEPAGVIAMAKDLGRGIAEEFHEIYKRVVDPEIPGDGEAENAPEPPAAGSWRDRPPLF